MTQREWINKYRQYIWWLLPEEIDQMWRDANMCCITKEQIEKKYAEIDAKEAAKAAESQYGSQSESIVRWMEDVEGRLALLTNIVARITEILDSEE